MTKSEAVEKLVKEINASINFCKNIIENTNPAYLLNRAYFSLASSQMGTANPTEAGDPLRRLVYIQCLIAGTTPSTKQDTEITDNDWDNLCGKINSIYFNVNLYLMSKYSNEFEYKACSSWVNISGKLYMNHQEDYLRDLFLPHDAIFQKLFNITAQDFVESLINISHSLSMGLDESMREMKMIYKCLDGDTDKLRNEYQTDPVFREKSESIWNRLFGMDIFDVQKSTCLPASLLDSLSFKPGEDVEFMKGEFPGWPIQNLPTKKRPFICINNHYYCFDQHSLYDNIYRVTSKIIRQIDRAYETQWKDIQTIASHEIAKKYFSKLLPGCKWIENYYYPYTKEDRKNTRPENDLLAIYDDHLFIIECKAGTFITESPFNNFDTQKKSVYKLLKEAHDQAVRFFNYLKGQADAPIYDDCKLKEKNIDLRHSDFKKIILCVINIDPFENYSTHPQDLDSIGFNIELPLLAISANDLRIYADVFDNPLVFLDFILARVCLFRKHSVFTTDETEFLARYLLKYNKQVSEHTKGLKNHTTTALGSIIDEYFDAKLQFPDLPALWRKYNEPRIQKLLDIISTSTSINKADISGLLLGLSMDWQRELFNSIESEVISQATTGLFRHISFDVKTASAPLSIYCWTRHVQHDRAGALDHARASVLLLKHQKRLLLELTYSDDNNLAHCEWQWVDRFSIPNTDISRLESLAANIKSTRFANVKAHSSKKIGRNQPCPCGSLIKYKNCCLKSQ